MKVTTDACLFGAWAASMYAAQKEHATYPANRRMRMLDIGTGTGLLSLMMAQGHPELEILAIEIDAAAAAEASSNIRLSPWASRIQVKEADVLGYPHGAHYDLIISNPPFYANDLKGPDPRKNLAHHNDGLLLPDLLALIRNRLSPSGQFFLLLPYKRLEEARLMAQQQGLLFSHIITVAPRTGQSPFRVMLQGQKAGTAASHSTNGELFIQDAAGNYTPAFAALLREYYLYL